MSIPTDPDVFVSAYLKAGYLLVDHTSQLLQDFLLQLGGWNIGLSPDQQVWEWAIPQAQMPRLQASSWQLIDNPNCSLFEAPEDEVKQFGLSEALRRANDRYTSGIVENVKNGGGLLLAHYYFSRCATLPAQALEWAVFISIWNSSHIQIKSEAIFQLAAICLLSNDCDVNTLAFDGDTLIKIGL